MKIFKLALLTLLSMGTLSASQYAGVEFGPTSLEITNGSHSGLKVGYRAGAKYGHEIAPNLHSEFAVAYSKNAFKNKYNFEGEDNLQSKEHRNFHSWSYMVNAIYELPALSVKSLVPHVGFGVGYCQNTEHRKIQYDHDSEQVKLKDDRFAYQAMVGANYALTPEYVAQMQYKYFCGQSHAKNHSVSLAVLKVF